MKTPCVCNTKVSAGDMAPRIWECPAHGKTGFASFEIAFEQQTLFTGHSDILRQRAKDEFWYFVMGIMVRKRAEADVQGEIYYDEDHLWTDVRKELDRIAKLGNKPTVRPVALGGMSPRAFGVPDHPQEIEAPKRGWIGRVFGKN